MQGDVQEPDLRCGTPGTSGHVTTKSSIRRGVCFINPAFMHRKLRVLPWEVSCTALERRVRGELAEGRAIDPDRMREVSRRHSRCRTSLLSGLETSPHREGEDSPHRRPERFSRGIK